jgi:Rha family phage regulatory protein
MFDAMSLLEFSEDKLCVSSLDVAYYFDRQHKNVLQSSENLDCSTKFRELNFQLSSYPTSQNGQLPLYRLTRDGFSMLVMGFTGPKASFLKEQYIQAFNLVEAELLKQHIIHAESRGRSKTIRVVSRITAPPNGFITRTIPMQYMRSCTVGPPLSFAENGGLGRR